MVASSVIGGAFSMLGEVLELVLVMQRFSVCTVASLVFLDGFDTVGSFPCGGGICLCPSGDGKRGRAVEGSVLFRIWGTSSSRILLQVTLPFARGDPCCCCCCLVFLSSSLFAFPLESEEEDRIEEGLVALLSTLM